MMMPERVASGSTSSSRSQGIYAIEAPAAMLVRDLSGPRTSNRCFGHGRRAADSCLLHGLLACDLVAACVAQFVGTQKVCAADLVHRQRLSQTRATMGNKLGTS